MSGGPAAIVVTPERFSGTNSTTLAAKAKHDVRRPTSGITLRDDTFASLRVVSGNGANQRIIDAGSRLKGGVDGSNPDQPLQVRVGDKVYTANETYSNFLLQHVQEERQEKVQILETFGEPYIFLFGERPRVLNCQGVLLNTWDFNWEAEWWANYDNFLRGTKCVENDARVYLAFDNTLVGGYILSANAQKQTQERNYVTFQFQLFVTYYETFSNLGNPYVVPGGVEVSKSPGDEVFDPSRPTYPVDGLEQMDRRVYNLLPDGSLQIDVPLSVAENLSGPSSLAMAWHSVQQTTRQVLSTVSQIWEGEVVRVPEGFSGAFAYEDSKLPELPFSTPSYNEGLAMYGQTVKYTTFADNADEYVGQGSHYGSADLRFTNRPVGILYNAISNSETISRRVALYFLENGIVPDGGIPGILANIVKIGRAALVGVNGITAIAGFAKNGIRPATPDLTVGWSSASGGSFSRSPTNAYPE